MKNKKKFKTLVMKIKQTFSTSQSILVNNVTRCTLTVTIPTFCVIKWTVRVTGTPALIDFGSSNFTF